MIKLLNEYNFYGNYFVEQENLNSCYLQFIEHSLMPYRESEREMAELQADDNWKFHALHATTLTMQEIRKIYQIEIREEGKSRSPKYTEIKEDIRRYVFCI